MDKKKKILTILVILLLIFAFYLTYLVFSKLLLKNNFEKDILPFALQNEKTVFQINKIVLFSNCDAKNKTGSASNFTIENLYQYTDIALFINASSKEEKTLENTLKKVSICNVQYPTIPELGEPKLYFKGLPLFAKSELSLENEISDSFTFHITSESDADLTTPTLYNNLANPITLSYINQNIKSDYTITDTSSPITYDGSLLKKCHVNLSAITCKLSFDLLITNNLEEQFKTTIFIDIPLETQQTSIYNGNIQVTQNQNFVFYRYQ